MKLPPLARLNVLEPEVRQRLFRRGLRAFKRRAPGVDRAVRALRAAVEPRYLRNPPSAGVVLDIGRFPYMGFGASIGWVHPAFIAQRALGVPLYVTGCERWPFGGRLSECALDRFIEFPGAHVVAAGEIPAGALPLAADDWGNLRRWGYFDDLDWPHCLFGFKPDGCADLEAFRRQVFAESYRLTRYAREAIAPMRAFLPPRYVAWHVRRGDKTAGRWQEDYPVPLTQYAAATAQLFERAPGLPRQLVVCTDSEDVLADAREVLRSFPGGLEVVHDPDERRWNGYCALHRTGQIERADEMVREVLTAQKIVEILRGAEALVGCNSSCLFRLAALLTPAGTPVTSLSENKAWKKYYPL